MVCDVDGLIAGYAYASPFKTLPCDRWFCELTVCVSSEFHRRGVGRALYAALLPCLAAQGYRVAVAVITVPNPASVGLHESIGMRRVGSYERIAYKFGQWLDDGVWQMELAPPSETHAPPVPVHDLVGTPIWENALRTGANLLRA